MSGSPPGGSRLFGGTSRTKILSETRAPHLTRIQSAHHSHDSCIDSSQVIDFCSFDFADLCPSYLADNCLHVDLNSSVDFCIDNVVRPSVDSNHSYPFTLDLLQLEACRAATAPPLPQSATAIATPLRSAAWEEALRIHPDQAFASYILQGIKHGFHIGFDGHRCTPKGSATNMRSAELNPAPVDDYLSR